MNNIYLRATKSIKSINLIYFLLAIPLILFGFYKNGIVVFMKGNINLLEMFIPLIIPFVFYYIAYLVVYYKNIKNRNIKVNEYSLVPIGALFLGMILPININILLSFAVFVIITIIYVYFFDNKVSINYIAVTLLVILLLNFVVSGIDFNSMFLNSYEQKGLVSYGISNQVLGYNYSGIASSNIIFILIFAIIVGLISIYKYEIPLSFILTFAGLTVVGKLLLVNSNILANIFNYSFLFIILFVANDIKTTPATASGKWLYGIVLAFFIFILSFLPVIINILISIILCSLLSPILDIICRKN